MYLYEFVINSKDKSLYGWKPKGNNGLRNNYTNHFSMSFMIGFYIRKFYGILGTTTTHRRQDYISMVNP